MQLMTEQWPTEDERWCEVCQDDDDPVVRGEPMPLTIPTPEFPFRVCADCADEWDTMMADDYAADYTAITQVGVLLAR